jgi:hypothetical protein
MSVSTKRKWTPELKKNLVSMVLQTPDSVPQAEMYKSLLKVFGGDNWETIRWTYYRVRRRDPEIYSSVVRELKSEGVTLRNTGAPCVIPELLPEAHSVPETIVAKEPIVIHSNEDSVLSSAGKLIESLSKLGGIDTSAFINGLTSIVERSNKANEVERLTSQIDELRSENNMYRETLEYISSTIGWYTNLTTGQKIENIKKITDDLRNSIFACLRDKEQEDILDV